MTKYNLLYYFDQAITTGTFPTKFQWKRVCSQTIHIYEQEQWNIRMVQCTDFYLDKLNHMTSDCSYYKIHATRTDYYAILKTFFSDSLCESILCPTSAKRVMYLLGYVDAALECNILTCK